MLTRPRLARVFAPFRRTRTAPILVDPGAFRRVLCVAPHPDDETLGCGGLLHLACGRGADALVVLLTLGEADPTVLPATFDGDDPARDRRPLAERRRDEFAAAMSIIGVTASHCLNGRDGQVRQEAVWLQRQLLEIAVRYEPDLVLAPGVREWHRDHRAAALLTRSAFSALRQQMCRRPLLLHYEVWTPQPPTHLVDIAAAIEAKRRALACYEARFTQTGLADTVLRRDRERAAMHLRRDGYAEGFRAVEPL